MKETTLVFPLDKNGKGFIRTEVIKGKFDAFLINAPKGQIRIFSERGYDIFYSTEMNGIMYVPVRVQVLDQVGHRIGFSNTPFHLNEKLFIEYQSTFLNTMSEVKIIIKTE